MVACGGANEHGPHGWWKYLERIGRCHLIGVGITGVGLKGSSPCQGHPLCILPLEQDVRSQSAYLPTAMLLTMMVKREASHQ